MIDTKILGLKDLDRALEQIAKEFGPKEGLKTLRAALRSSAKPVLDAAKANAPTKSGKLRDSIKVSLGKPNKEDRDNGATSETVAVARIKAGNTKKANAGGVFYANFVEYGTERNAPTPFLRSAIENQSDTSVAIFAHELEKSIDKSIKRLQKKANKGGK